jgi:lysophospholipase L1-like esterase
VPHPSAGGDARDIAPGRHHNRSPASARDGGPDDVSTPINWPVKRKEDVLPHLTTALSVAGIALLVAACSATPDPPASGTRTPAAAASTTKAAATPAAATPAAASALHGSYVALGDSYTAGLGIPAQTGSTAGCGQSTSSYPYLVARSLRLDLTDMSCSSATIPDLTGAQVTGHGANPAQLSALSSGTALVTVSIGGNDIGMIDIVTKCAELDLGPALIPGRSSRLTPCEDYYTSGGTDQIQQRIQAVTGNLADTLTQIKERAPHARVYVVGYPDLLPSGGGGCGGALGITAGDIAFLNREEVRLNRVLEQVARAAGDGYVNTYAPSEGHDACAAPASRWLEPLLPSSPAAPLHPNAAGERGMADAVVAAVKSASYSG